MTKNTKLFFIAALIFCFGATFANAQKAPDYKITNVKILPFEGQTGEFQAPLKSNDDRSFFNAIDTALLVVVEITGKAGTFEEGRTIQITAMEGKKLKAKKSEQIGLIGDGGKFYVPLWLDAAMCSEVTITAKITGQKSASSLTRKVMFECGE